jgi:hypothetical protein
LFGNNLFKDQNRLVFGVEKDSAFCT